MSKPAVAEDMLHDRKEMPKSDSSSWMEWLLVLLFGAGALFALIMPEFLYEAVINVVLTALSFYGLILLFQFIVYRPRSFSKLVYGLLAVGFAGFLTFNSVVPEWIVRVVFGLYCAGVSFCMLIQIVITWNNEGRLRLSLLFFTGIYGLLGYILLFTDLVSTLVLIRIFGVYFLMLTVRFALDLFDRTSDTYQWKRRIRVSLPTVFATIMPDFVLAKINEHFRHGKEYPLSPAKKKEPVKLKAMVHIGPEGFQKVGHFTFSWKGTVYSYGNYDKESGRLLSMCGDGVFFTVPDSVYLPNIITHENNTIFEYSIETTPAQDALIEKELQDLKNRSYRWYCQLERRGSMNLHGLEADYASRLHYRTGAKFYKIRHGCFKTYWFAGENCVQFADVILGSIGSDVLSLRGIITPGAYYDYLESEFSKPNSPVVDRRVYSPRAGEKGI